MISEEARKARAEYQRRWRKNNPDKAKAYQDRYWENRLRREFAEEQEQGEQSNGEK